MPIRPRPEDETLLVLDEAFVTFVADAWSSVPLIKEGNLLALRSMTKDYALAGLRLGYAVSHPDVISALRQVHPPWSVNALAQAAGVAALLDEAHLRRSLASWSGPRKRWWRVWPTWGSRRCPRLSTSFWSRWGTALLSGRRCSGRGSWCGTAPPLACRHTCASPPAGRRRTRS